MKTLAYHFWSSTCGPCKAIKPALQDLKEEFPNIEWVSVNTHDDKNDYAGTFGVTIVPTVVVVVVDDMDRIISQEKHSGTSIAGYYRIIRAAIQKATSV